MRSFLRLCLWLCLPAGVFAALDQQRFTAKELAQGYADGTVIAKPLPLLRLSVDAAEQNEGIQLRQRFERFGDLRVLRLRSGDTVTQAIKRLRATGRYEYVEADRILRARTVPNDPSFSKQWSLRNTGQTGGTSGVDIGAVTAWTTRTDASSVIVGVLDSGIRLTHRDLSANLWTDSSTGYHGLSAVGGSGGISDYTPNDSEVGHGTHVAGIIGARGNNGTGISGIAWKVQLMGLRFLSGTDGSGATSDAITCINYALNKGVKIINASYGSSVYSKAEYDAIKAARAKGVIFVAAAGNDTLNTDHGNDYPAGYALDNIVTVAATDDTDALADYSNYGPGTVDLAAPGSDIFSTYYSSDTSYATMSGTSMATPHVTGVLALLRAKYPSDTYRQTINRLLRSTAKLTTLSGKVQTAGRLNLAAAITSTSNLPFNDAFASRATLAGDEIRVRSSNLGATTETGEPTSAGVATLWWTWKATASTQVLFETTGSTGNDTRLAVYTGAKVSALTLVGSNDNTSSSVTTSSLTLSVTAGTTYQIAVGSKTSATAGFVYLHVGAIPANNTFAKATTLSGVGVQTAGTTYNATKETGESLAVTGAAGHSVWYKWVAPATGHYSLAAFATEIDTVAAVYTGSAVKSLTKVASNDNNQDAGNSDCLVSFNATKGTTYYFQVDHYSYTGVTGGDFILTVTDSLWEYPTYDEVTSSPAVTSAGNVYFGSVDGTVYALTSAGALKWSYATGDAIDGASPAIGSDGTVYLGSNDGYLYALNGSTGALKWRVAAASAIASTPAIASDKTVYFRDNTRLYALTDKGGSVVKKWQFSLTGSTSEGTYSSPAIGKDGTIYVGTNGGVLHAVTAAGKQKWKFTADDDIFTSPSIASDGTVYFATLQGTVYALKDNGTSATKKWSASRGGGKSITSSLSIAADGTLYFGGYDGKLHALTASTGAEKWTCTLGAEVRASTPAVASDGTIYVGSYDGKLYAVSSAGKLVRTYPAALKIRSSPVLAGTRLYFGSSDAKLHAFTVSKGLLTTSAWPMFQANALHTAVASTTATTTSTATAASTTTTTSTTGASRGSDREP